MLLLCHQEMKIKLVRICIIICVGVMLCICLQMKMLLAQYWKNSMQIETIWDRLRVDYNMTRIPVAIDRVFLSLLLQGSAEKDVSKRPYLRPQTTIGEDATFTRATQVNATKPLWEYSGQPQHVQTPSDKGVLPSKTSRLNSDISKFFTITGNQTKDPFINQHLYDFNLIAFSGVINELFLIMIINSAPGNFRKRELIRATYRSVSKYKGRWMTSVFMLGGVEDDITQEAIDQENQLHKDIVQGKFLDNYRNQNEKHIMGLHWFKHLCVAEYVLKVDDNTFINPFRVVDFLMDVKPSGLTMYCSIGSNIKPNRNKSSKWYVSPEEYPFASYPGFCLGAAYLTTSEASNAMYKASETTRPLPMDDVFVALLLALQANVQQIDMKPTFTVCSETKLYDVNELNKKAVVYDPFNQCGDLAFQFWGQILKKNPCEMYTPSNIFSCLVYGYE